MTEEHRDSPDDAAVSRDPELRFHSAREVLDSDLERAAKIEILRQWAFDLREQMVAQEENMAPAREPQEELGAVLRALDELGAEEQPERSAPSKLGPGTGD
jgi:hypothetical protein